MSQQSTMLAERQEAALWVSKQGALSVGKQCSKGGSLPAVPRVGCQQGPLVRRVRTRSDYSEFPRRASFPRSYNHLELVTVVPSLERAEENATVEALVDAVVEPRKTPRDIDAEFEHLYDHLPSYFSQKEVRLESRCTESKHHYSMMVSAQKSLCEAVDGIIEANHFERQGLGSGSLDDCRRVQMKISASHAKVRALTGDEQCFLESVF